MRKPDLVLLHPPTTYDFRRKSILFGPISDVVPSTPLFEMYPIGFLSMASHLYHRGFKVKIINLAYRMIKEPAFRPEQHLSKVESLLYGVDLHWLPHCRGAIDTAEMIKRLK